MAVLIPQEIYLIERYISLDYYGDLRDTWGEMVDHLQRCLDTFMRDLPQDYRRRPLPEQPDAVWGERVIPNFRMTYQGLCDGFIELSHNDLVALKNSYGVLSDFKGQTDFWSGWMSKEDDLIYGNLLGKAVMLAGNIISAIGAGWRPELLTAQYDEDIRGPLIPPVNWPFYETVRTISVKSGEVVKQTGIYLPDTDSSCAEFLYAGRSPATEASTLTEKKDLFIPGTQKKYTEQSVYEKRACVWTLVKRSSDAGAIYTLPSLTSQVTHRVRAGDACPQSGYYITPARIDSRRKFQQGEIMPGFESNYGEIIWQWDMNQNT